jgi:predicted transcriptional regulator YheO
MIIYLINIIIIYYFRRILMDKKTIEQYSIIVEFLGKALGPDYEVVLHDVENYNNSILAIANGHVSGRTLGAPITNFGLSTIADKSYKDSEYKVNYNGVSRNHKVLRSSSMFIKDDKGELIGLLCINFDDTKYIDISNQILKLCHPDSMVDVQNTFVSSTLIIEDDPESFTGSIPDVTSSVLNQVLEEKEIPLDKISSEERLQIVEILDKKGVFMLKGAVSEVAKQLSCSEPSIYRYLSKINKD